MEKRCYGCMRIKQHSPQCEHCGFVENTPNALHQLPVGTVLREQYIIGRVLGQGGFGITYLAWDRNLEMPVAIKEYYPSGMVSRNGVTSSAITCNTDPEQFREGCDRFQREASTLVRLQNVGSIVKVTEFFMANNTAYIVMEYLRGITLQEYIRERGGRLTVSETFAVLRPVMQALHRVHEEGMIHRDISPDNIMLQDSGTVKLLDFGTARGLDSTGSQLTHSTQAVLKHGFAPMEQYAAGKAIDRRADEYALCATAWYCLTGQIPPDAPSMIMEKTQIDWSGIPGLTDGQRSVLEKGTAFLAEDRYPDLTALEKNLFADGEKPEPERTKEKTGKARPRKTAPARQKKPERKQKWLLPAMAVAAAVLAAALLLAGGRLAETLQAPEAAGTSPETAPTETLKIQETTPEAAGGTQETTPEAAGATQGTTPQTAAEPAAAEVWKENVLRSDVVKPYVDRQYSVFGSSWKRSQIVSITFLSSLENAPAEAWDVSKAGDGRVLAWVEANGKRYDLYIAGEGGVRAPANCNALFACYKNAAEINFNDSFHVTPEVTNLSYMFYNCAALTDLDLGSFDTSKVTDMRWLFGWCSRLTSLDVSGFDTSGVTDMSYMFYREDSLTSLELSSFDTAKVKNMECMFYGCKKLASLELSSFNTAKVTNMGGMFYGCKKLVGLDLSGFDTSRVTNMGGMLGSCGTLKDLKLGTWETGKVSQYSFFMDSGVKYKGKPWTDLF